jgi:two-component system response regulator FixJ
MTDAVIYVIDDDDAARQSLEFLLGSSELAVQSFDSASEFLKSLPVSSCSCIVTDVLMPDITGIDLMKRLIELNINIPVIVITGVGDVPLAVEAMKLGAVDFFEKPFDGDALVAAVRRALAGSLSDAVRETERITIQNRIAGLSSRERDVLAALAEGHPNKTIAYDLGMSPRAVDVHRANVMRKMNARNLAELVRMAWLAGTATATPRPQIHRSGSGG